MLKVLALCMLVAAVACLPTDELGTEKELEEQPEHQMDDDYDNSKNGSRYEAEAKFFNLINKAANDPAINLTEIREKVDLVVKKFMNMSSQDNAKFVGRASKILSDIEFIIKDTFDTEVDLRSNVLLFSRMKRAIDTVQSMRNDIPHRKGPPYQYIYGLDALEVPSINNITSFMDVSPDKLTAFQSGVAANLTKFVMDLNFPLFMLGFGGNTINNFVNDFTKKLTNISGEIAGGDVSLITNLLNSSSMGLAGAFSGTGAIKMLTDNVNNFTSYLSLVTGRDMSKLMNDTLKYAQDYLNGIKGADVDKYLKDMQSNFTSFLQANDGAAVATFLNDTNTNLTNILNSVSGPNVTDFINSLNNNLTSLLSNFGAGNVTKFLDAMSAQKIVEFLTAQNIYTVTNYLKNINVYNAVPTLIELAQNFSVGTLPQTRQLDPQNEIAADLLQDIIDNTIGAIENQFQPTARKDDIEDY